MRKGFSYIETVIALAVFSIALLPLLPMLRQASRNEAYTEEAYTAQLHAQGIMAAVRDAAIRGADIAAGADEYVAGLSDPPASYGIWYKDFVRVTGEEEFDFTPAVSLNGISGEAVTVICRGGDGNIYGRAVGIVPNG